MKKRGAGSTLVRKSSRGRGGVALRTRGVRTQSGSPDEVEEATRGIAACGASVSASPSAPREGGGSTRVRRPNHPAKGPTSGERYARARHGPRTPSLRPK
eukprot:6919204-Prymnesium_polylepis.1